MFSVEHKKKERNEKKNNKSEYKVLPHFLSGRNNNFLSHYFNDYVKFLLKKYFSGS